MEIMNQSELKDLVNYEVFLLVESYRIIKNPISKKYTEILEYPHDGSAPKLSIIDHINMISGDWRSGFLRAGGPLIFSSAFKVLDLIVEWVLGPDSRTAKLGSLQFNEKVTRIKDPTRTWPDFFSKHSWIKERFIALYESLIPYRNTIIHSSQFSSIEGGVKVAPSEGKGVFGDYRHIDSNMVGHIAYVAALIAKVLQGVWDLDPYTNHRLRWSLNKLYDFHKLPSDDCLKPPSLALVRIYRNEAKYIIFNIAEISLELNQPMLLPVEGYGDVDCRRTHAIFDLEIIIKGESDHNSVYQIPFTSIDLFKDGISLEQLVDFEVS